MSATAIVRLARRYHVRSRRTGSLVYVYNGAEWINATGWTRNDLRDFLEV